MVEQQQASTSREEEQPNNAPDISSVKDEHDSEEAKGDKTSKVGRRNEMVLMGVGRKWV